MGQTDGVIVPKYYTTNPEEEVLIPHGEGLPEGIVPKYYTMNPEEEVLIPHGKGLAEGMVILIENPDKRGDSSEFMLYQGETAKILTFNRWMKIIHILEKEYGLRFVAEYEDGSQRLMILSLEYAWLVKKSSLPN